VQELEARRIVKLPRRFNLVSCHNKFLSVTTHLGIKVDRDEAHAWETLFAQCVAPPSLVAEFAERTYELSDTLFMEEGVKARFAIVSVHGNYLKVDEHGNLCRGRPTVVRDGWICSEPHADEVFELSWGPYSEGSYLLIRSVKRDLFVQAAHGGKIGRCMRDESLWARWKLVEKKSGKAKLQDTDDSKNGVLGNLIGWSAEA